MYMPYRWFYPASSVSTYYAFLSSRYLHSSMLRPSYLQVEPLESRPMDENCHASSSIENLLGLYRAQVRPKGVTLILKKATWSPTWRSRVTWQNQENHRPRRYASRDIDFPILTTPNGRPDIGKIAPFWVKLGPKWARQGAIWATNGTKIPHV